MYKEEITIMIQCMNKILTNKGIELENIEKSYTINHINKWKF